MGGIFRLDSGMMILCGPYVTRVSSASCSSRGRVLCTNAIGTHGNCTMLVGTFTLVTLGCPR